MGLFSRLFLDKDAREALKQRDKVKQQMQAKAGKPQTEREAAIAQMQAQVKGAVNPERAELIRHAMEVHRAKAKILESLDSETREKLVELAFKQLLNQDRKKD